MKLAFRVGSHRLERALLVAAGAAFVVSVLLAWHAPAPLVGAWRFAVFICLQPALGSLIFILIHRLTGGRWMEGLAPFLAGGARLLPWIWLLALPLAWSPLAPHHADEHASGERGAPKSWTAVPRALDATSANEPSRHVDASLRSYFSRPMLVTRALGYAVIFFLLAAGAARASALPWFGPAGLLGLVFALHLLVVDWLVSLEPGWRSTGFPLVWMTGQGVAGLAAAILAAVSLGAAPASDPHERARGLDWGNLLLAAVMAWTYVAFVEWLIIWSGNLPPETAWYRHRAHGVWGALVLAIAIVGFAFPFALLLSRRAKRSRFGLRLAAAAVLVGQLAYTIWVIAPALPIADASTPWLVAAVGIGAAMLFLNRYLAAARRLAAIAPP